MQKDLNKKIGQATKWSTITEIGTKLVAPITNAILARLLAPEAFGVVATLTMVITFAEIFTDAGFQKYLVQHEFRDEEDLNASTNMAFWTNILFSMAIWGMIALFAKPIASLVGSEGHELAIIVISAEIPLLAFSSIQLARFRREFDYKNLFFVRLAVAFVPLLITVPAALILRSHWALVAGTLAKDLLNAIVLTVRSKWKPSFRFNFAKLKEMLSFSLWTVLENITIWLSTNSGTFIIGSILGAYYLGLYKTTVNTIGSYFGIIQSIALPVVFAALSRCQDHDSDFEQVFFRFQRMVALLVFPLGFGIFVYRELGTWILLGNQWTETALFLGLRSLALAFLIVFSYFNSEAFRSKGKPKLSALAQLADIVITVPLLCWGASQSYDILILCSTLSCFAMIVTTMLLAHMILKIRVLNVLKNIYPSLLSAMIMAAVGYFARTLFAGILWECTTVLVCVVIYIVSLWCIPDGRKQLSEIPFVGKFLHANR